MRERCEEDKLKAVEAEHCEECNFPLTDFGTPKGLECQLCNARDKIESLTSQLKIAREALEEVVNVIGPEAPNLPNASKWDYEGLASEVDEAIQIANEALQKISEVGK